MATVRLRNRRRGAKTERCPQRKQNGTSSSKETLVEPGYDNDKGANLQDTPTA